MIKIYAYKIKYQFKNKYLFETDKLVESNKNKSYIKKIN